jgi:cytochrome c peroxidase
MAEMWLGPQRLPSVQEEGEALFYDARLSHRSWLSCHSCHTDGHGNGRLSDTLGDGSFGAPKRVLSLLGAADTGPWAWNGSMTTLEEQIQKSIVTTLCGKPPSKEQVAALTAYVRSLKPPPSVAAARSEATDSACARGEKVFHQQGCAKCHEPSTYTSPRTYDVNLSGEVGNARFNPPSLRGLSQRDAVFHDNRASTLKSALANFRHGLKDNISDGNLSDLMAFLAGL